jgi:hypothetical protein
LSVEALQKLRALGLIASRERFGAGAGYVAPGRASTVDLYPSTVDRDDRALTVVVP